VFFGYTDGMKGWPQKGYLSQHLPILYNQPFLYLHGLSYVYSPNSHCVVTFIQVKKRHFCGTPLFSAKLKRTVSMRQKMRIKVSKFRKQFDQRWVPEVKSKTFCVRGLFCKLYNAVNFLIRNKRPLITD